LIESDEFKRWLNGAGLTLYCPGIPGSGKTMLTSIVIDHLTKSVQGNRIGSAYIYCGYQRQLEQTPVNLLASLLGQLVQSRSSISDEVKNLYKCHIGRNSRPTLDEVSTALHSEIGRYTRVNILVDALDECTVEDGTRHVLLSRLRVLQSIKTVSLMVTSRSIPTIQQQFQSVLQLEIRASDEDVQRYLEGQMDRLASCVTRKAALQDEIISKIINTVDGMYVSLAEIEKHIRLISVLGFFWLDFIWNR
jgi:Cdc6-like AAA superfamily ATPase